jgi:hypothetical protein
VHQSSAPNEVIPQNWPWDPVRLVLDEPYSFLDPDKTSTYFRTSQYEIVAGVWTIFAGYVWDGATWVPDGDPDPARPNFPVTWKATLIHDIGYSGLRKFGKAFPYTRKQLDVLFREKLKEVNFKYANAYYWGVRRFGKYFINYARAHKRTVNTIAAPFTKL